MLIDTVVWFQFYRKARLFNSELFLLVLCLGSLLHGLDYNHRLSSLRPVYWQPHVSDRNMQVRICSDRCFSVSGTSSKSWSKSTSFG